MTHQGAHGCGVAGRSVCTCHGKCNPSTSIRETLTVFRAEDNGPRFANFVGGKLGSREISSPSSCCKNYRTLRVEVKMIYPPNKVPFN